MKQYNAVAYLQTLMTPDMSPASEFSFCFSSLASNLIAEPLNNVMVGKLFMCF